MYQKLKPVRSLIEEAQSHSEAMHSLKIFSHNASPLKMTVYSKTYQVVTEQETKKVKTNEYKQSFSIYDNDQLISTGNFLYFFREPREVLGDSINKRGQIYSNIRDIATIIQDK